MGVNRRGVLRGRRKNPSLTTVFLRDFACVLCRDLVVSEVMSFIKSC